MYTSLFLFMLFFYIICFGLSQCEPEKMPPLEMGYVSFFYEINCPFDPQTPTWPTASGITEDSANSTCTTGITNIDGYNTCLAFNAVDFETEISNCMGDILRTDSIAWAASTISSVKASCK